MADANDVRSGPIDDAHKRGLVTGLVLGLVVGGVAGGVIGAMLDAGDSETTLSPTGTDQDRMGAPRSPTEGDDIDLPPVDVGRPDDEATPPPAGTETPGTGGTTGGTPGTGGTTPPR